MYKDLENGFDGFMKNFKNMPSENTIDELKELGVTFVQIGDSKLNYEEDSEMKLQANKFKKHFI